jgi:hypothetical protein
VNDALLSPHKALLDCGLICSGCQLWSDRDTGSKALTQFWSASQPIADLLLTERTDAGSSPP